MRSVATASTTPSSKKSKSSNFTLELPSLEEISSATKRILKQLCKDHSIPNASAFTRVGDLREYVKNWLVDELGQAPPESPDTEGNAAARPSQARLPDLRAHDVTSTDAAKNPAFNTLCRLRDILADIGNEQQSERGTNLLERGKLLVEGLLAGLELSAAFISKPSDPILTKRSHFPSFADVAKKFGKSWETIPKEKINDLKSTRIATRKAALSSLYDIKRRSGPSSDTRLWEPRMDGYRQKEISRHSFRSQLDASLREKLDMQTAPIAFCSERLDRGGFLVQLTDEAEERLSNSTDQDIQTATNGTWFRLPKPTHPTGNSIVVERISEGISVEEVIEDITLNNFPAHGLSSKEVEPFISGGERLKRRDLNGDWIPATAVSVFMDRKLSNAVLA